MLARNAWMPNSSTPFAFKIRKASTICSRSHAVFGVARVVHDVVADLKQSARVVAAADMVFGRYPTACFHFFNMCDVIQIDDGAQISAAFLNSCCRCVVGGEHDIMSGDSEAPRRASALSWRSSHSRSHTPAEY